MGNKSSLMLQDEEIKTISDETGFSASQIEKLYARFAHLDRTNCGSLTKGDLLSIPELAINPLCDRLIQMFFSDCDDPNDERINFKQFMRVLSTFNHSPSCNSSPPQQPPPPTGSLAHNSSRNNLKQSSGSGPIDKIKSVSSQLKGKFTNEPTGDDPFLAGKRKLEQAKQAGGKRSSLELSASRGKLFYDANSNNSKFTSIKLMNDNLKNKLLFIFKIYDADNDGKISFHDLRSILKMMVGNYIEDVQLDKIANRAFLEVNLNNNGFIEFDEFCKVFSGRDLDDKLRVKFFN